MRTLLAIMCVILAAMTAGARLFVRPDPVLPDDVIDSLFAIDPAVAHPAAAAVIEDFTQHILERGDVEAVRVDLAAASRDPELRVAMARSYEARVGHAVSDVPRLVWSTGPNPARRVQMAMFRAWHFETFGSAVDIVADPSNRDLTKSIVQSVAGAGPDVIEYIGGAHLTTLVDAGIALDITEYAQEHDFGIGTVFPAAVSSVARADAAGQMRQYGYPCNLDYKVLLYHRDLFDQAGVAHPSGGWSIDEMRAVASEVLASQELSIRPAFAFMSLGPFDAVLAGGGELFATSTRAYSAYNSDETVRALELYQDLMYVHGTMPRPAEAASMSASTAGGFGGGSTVSAPGLFAQKSVLMHVGGRWEYVVYAIANRDRVYVPAIDRTLSGLDTESHAGRIAALESARESLLRDVLLPLKPAELAALRECLNDGDRAGLLHIGVAHVPTSTGTPYYAVAARSSVVNRALTQRDPERLAHAKRFIRFLGSEAYNEQINGTFDSIAGRVEYCVDDDGVAGVPAALPGLEDFDAPVFTEVVLDYGAERVLSEYIGRHRLMRLMTEVLEDVQSGSIEPGVAARRAEEAVNRQIVANVMRDARLRAQWVLDTGVDPSVLVPGLRDSSGRSISLREQIERAGFN